MAMVNVTSLEMLVTGYLVNISKIFITFGTSIVCTDANLHLQLRKLVRSFHWP